MQLMGPVTSLCRNGHFAGKRQCRRRNDDYCRRHQRRQALPFCRLVLPQLRVGCVELDYGAVVSQRQIVLKNIPVGSARVVFNAQGVFAQCAWLLRWVRTAANCL